MIDAARVAASAGFDAGRLIVAAVVDEEYASIGADALVESLARRRGGRHRADRPADRVGAQGIRVGRGRDARPRRARQPARGRARRDPADGTRAASRSRRSIASCRRAAASAAGHRLAARVDHRGRARAEQLSRSRAGCRWSGARCRRDRATRFAEEIERSSTACAARIPSSTRRSHAALSRGRRTRLPRDHELPRRARAAALEPDGDHPRRHELLDGCRGAGERRAFPSVLFGPGGAGLHSTEEYVDVADVIALPRRAGRAGASAGDRDGAGACAQVATRSCASTSRGALSRWRRASPS